MNDELLRQYAIIVADTICSISRGFGPQLNEWNFMLVEQPKIPFANESKVPNITHTYKLHDNAEARKMLTIVYRLIFDKEYEFSDSDYGQYLICYPD
jgi:hypothetical protein